MELKFDEAFWSARYLSGHTGWDLSRASTPLYQYLCQIERKDLQILVPGAGNAHEVIAAWNLGFTNIFSLDISKIPIEEFSNRFPQFPKGNLLHGDFFDHKGSYDLILEQTFFCSLHPSLREKYAQKMFELLKPGGSLVGVLFNREFDSGPPFGGNQAEYLTYFTPYFDFVVFENCYNSELPRLGKELFIHLKKSKR